MAEEEVKQVEGETPPTEATPRTYSQEEVDASNALALEQGEDIGKKKEFDRINPILSQQGADLKRLKEQPLSKRSSTDKIHLEEMEAREKDTGEVNPRITQLKAEIAKEEKLEAEAEQARISSLQETIDGYRQRVGALGLTEEDEDYWSIKSLVERGEYKPAEIKLNKLETTKKEKPVDKTKEVEEDLKAKWIEEGKRLAKEELNMLSSDNNLPSGAGGKKTYKLSELPNVEAQIAKLPESERKVARRDILDAFNEGRVKEE